MLCHMRYQPIMQTWVLIKVIMATYKSFSPALAQNVSWVSVPIRNAILVYLTLRWAVLKGCLVNIRQMVRLDTCVGGIISASACAALKIGHGWHDEELPKGICGPLCGVCPSSNLHTQGMHHLHQDLWLLLCKEKWI